MMQRMGRCLAKLVGSSARACHASRLRLRSTASFRRLHVTYFLFFSGAGAAVLWLLSVSPSDHHRLPFVDSLFTSVSALSVTGLGTVPMHRFSASAQAFILLLMILGSQVFTSAIPLFIRGAVSTRSISRFSSLLLSNSPPPPPFFSFTSMWKSLHSASPQRPAGHGMESSSSSSHIGDGHASLSPVPLITMVAAYADSDSDADLESRREPETQASVDSPLPPLAAAAKVVKRAASMPLLPTFKWSQRIQPEQQQRTNHNLPLPSPDMAADPPNQDTISEGPGLGPEEAPVRGLVEQEALVILSWAVSMYFIAMQVLGFLVCLGTVLSSETAKRVLREREVNREFFALFSTVSAFANAGFSLLDDNLVSMQHESAFLLWMCVLILVGNTLFAPALRGVVWVLFYTLAPDDADEEMKPRDIKTKKKLRRRAALHYLLTSPRRCFTHLFPRSETLWLLFCVAVLSTIQFVAICGLDWHGPVFAGLTSHGDKLVNALFSSITTRNAGLNVANVAAFSPPTLVLLLVMMYIAVYPVYLSRERSKEQVDGPTINSKEVMADSQEKMMTTSKEKMIRIFRVLLARDSLYLVIATFWICLTERNSIQEDPLNFSIFNILFEIISAYGNVGLSFGYSCALQLSSSKDTCVDVPYSFSGKWSTGGKVILICVMLLGRHRALPDDLDWAISLPSYS